MASSMSVGIQATSAFSRAVERTPPDAAGPVGRLYEVLRRALGQFAPRDHPARAAGEIDQPIALHPPAAILRHRA